MTHVQTPSRLALVAAFAAIYLVWGSTYLAIVFAMESIPPMLMLGTRFGFAGLLVYGWCRLRGMPNPSRLQVRNASLVGTLTLAVGTGSVAWAEQWVPSGIAALLATSTPLWMVVLDWKWRGAPRPNAYVGWGMALGVGGILLLVKPGGIASDPDMMLGMAAILGATVMFAVGAILGRDLELPEQTLMSTATQMMAGGAVLTLVGLAIGEPARLILADVTTVSWSSWLYLLFFGSIVAYGSFVWLMRNAPAAQVSTHAYVNPVVAVVLGAVFAGEVIDQRVLGAIGLLLAAVVLISRFGGPRRVVLGGGASRMPIMVRWMPPTSRGVLHAFAHSLDRPAMSLPRPVGSLVRETITAFDTVFRNIGTRGPSTREQPRVH